MVPMAGIGPATSPLPRECSTTEPHGPVSTTTGLNPIIWSGRRGSNSRHSVWKTEALPTELHPRYSSGAAIHTLLAGFITCSQANKPYNFTSFCFFILVEGEGFEPSYSERTDLQSVAFNHSATPPNRTRDYAYISTFCQMLTLKKRNQLSLRFLTFGWYENWCRVSESN